MPLHTPSFQGIERANAFRDFLKYDQRIVFDIFAGGLQLSTALSLAASSLHHIIKQKRLPSIDLVARSSTLGLYWGGSISFSLLMLWVTLMPRRAISGYSAWARSRPVLLTAIPWLALILAFLFGKKTQLGRVAAPANVSPLSSTLRHVAALTVLPRGLFQRLAPTGVAAVAAGALTTVLACRAIRLARGPTTDPHQGVIAAAEVRTAASAQCAAFTVWMCRDLLTLLADRVNPAAKAE